MADGSEISDKQKSYAKFLLEQPEGHTPEQIIAALLQIAEPAPALKGYALEKITEKPNRRSDSQRPPRNRDFGENQGLSKRDLSGSYDVFEINWGFRNGGNASKILSHLCRRGNINRAAVGQINVGTDSSTFEISDTVSESFAKASGRPDSRDPDLNIRRSKSTSVPRRPRRPKSDRGKGHRSFGGREKAGTGRRR